MRRSLTIKRLAAGLFVLAASGSCQDSGRPVAFEFAAVYDEEPLTCKDPDSVRLTDLRFYVHDIAVSDEAGEWHPLHLTPLSPWQTKVVAFIDLEDGADGCRGGSPFVRTVVEGETETDTITGLRFTVGVPFELNHQDPVRAESPLNQSIMHWHWQGGYKFMRAGLETSDGGAWFHLGSTQCQGTVGAIERCNYPNRVDIQLDDFDPSADRVMIHLDALFAGVDMTGRGPAGCMASRADEFCAPILTNLSLRDGSSGPSAVFRRSNER